ncbi:MAG: methyltransferase domain-containing protein [Methanomicrobiales archaeon]|nr:methyltransferase domain-containing protein [Methanomicrobiales archaeon]
MSAPSRQSLATGFRNVDTSGDTDACQRCLDLIAGIPFFSAVKHDSIRLIAGAAPESVLDAGCGAGVDLAALHENLPPHCRITGFDASGSLLKRARVRTRGIRDRCTLVKGDLLATPFRPGSFEAVRIDRVLQHIRQPDLTIRELARVLKSGGTLVAFDNDWDTFSLSLDDRKTVDRIRIAWRDSFASGRVGADLPGIFSASGFGEVHAEPRTLILTDLPVAEQVFDLSHLLERMENTGVLRAGQAGAIRRELEQKAQKGMFTSGYTGYLVTGIKED